MEPETKSSEQHTIPEWTHPILFCMYKTCNSFPAFNSSTVKKIIFQSNSIKSFANVGFQTYPELKEYRVTFHKKNQEVSLVYAPKLQRILIKENWSNCRSTLINTYFLELYENLKDVLIVDMKFEEYSDKKQVVRLLHRRQKDQKDQIEQNEKQRIKNEKYHKKQFYQEGKHEKKAKNALEKLINPKKYEIYLSNHEMPEQKQFSYKMEFRSCSISTLPQLKCKQIKEFIFAENGIKSIEQFAKGFYPFVTQLNLNRNFIQEVPLLNMPEIQRAAFSRNNLVSIERFCNGHYPKLMRLYLDSNNLKKLPKINGMKLQTIWLHENKFSDMEGFFSGCHPELFQLELVDQKLEDIKQISFPQLKNLNISKNKLKSIPVLNTPQLVYLYLGNNKITDTSSLNNHNLTLSEIQLHNNLIQILHLPNTSQLQKLYLSDNPIKNFHEITQLQFPLLKDFVFTGCNRKTAISIPKLTMPLVKFISFQRNSTHFEESFFEGHYPKLEYIDFGYCRTTTKLKKFKAPKLQKIYIQESDIENITDFIQGQYPNLQSFALPSHLKLGLDQNGYAQQLITHKDTSKPIIPLNFKVSQMFKKLIFESFLRVINIDLEVVKSLEFLTFLNLVNCREINFKKVRNKVLLAKNMVKINFETYKQIYRLQMESVENENIINFAWPFSGLPLYIQNSDLWRRIYKKSNPVRWLLGGHGQSEDWRKYRVDIRMEKFENRLTGYSHRKILEKAREILKNRFKEQPVIEITGRKRQMINERQMQEMIRLRDGRLVDNRYRDEIRNLFRQRNSPLLWRSPRMIRRGYDERVRNPEFIGPHVLRCYEVANNFFKQLRCPLANFYLGFGQYWFFEGMRDVQNIQVSTIDGGSCHFVVSFGMIKLTQMGVNHFLQSQGDGYNSDVCIDCLIKVDRLVRQLHEILGIECPLGYRKKNIESYKSMGNSSGARIQIKM